MKNYNGESISGIRQLKKPEYGTGKNNRFGQPVVNWNYLSKYYNKKWLSGFLM